MSERAPYSRVYWTVRNDPRLAGIYSDDHHWAAWNRLLLAADMAWPAPADLPANARRSSVKALEAAGVIELLPGGMFTFHGLDTERGKRREAAREAAARRTGSERQPDGDRLGTGRPPSLAEPSRDEQSQAEPQRVDDPADTYWTLTGKYPTDKTLAWIDDLTEQYGAATVIRHLAEEHVADRDARTLMGRVTDLCRRDGRTLSLKDRAAEKARIAERRVDPNVIRARHQTGQHQAAPDDACSLCRGAA